MGNGRDDPVILDPHEESKTAVVDKNTLRDLSLIKLDKISGVLTTYTQADESGMLK